MSFSSLHFHHTTTANDPGQPSERSLEGKNNSKSTKLPWWHEWKEVTFYRRQHICKKKGNERKTTQPNQTVLPSQVLKSVRIVHRVCLIFVVITSSLDSNSLGHQKLLIRGIFTLLLRNETEHFQIRSATGRCNWLTLMRARVCVCVGVSEREVALCVCVSVSSGCCSDWWSWYKQFACCTWDRRSHGGVRKAIYPTHNTHVRTSANTHTKHFSYTYFHLEVRETEAGSLLCPVSWSEEEESCERSLMEEYSKTTAQWSADCVKRWLREFRLRVFLQFTALWRHSRVQMWGKTAFLSLASPSSIFGLHQHNTLTQTQTHCYS